MVNLKTQRRSGGLIPFVSRMGNRNDELPSLMRRFLTDDYASDLFAQPVTWMPPVEVTEVDKEILITAELPGMSEKDIEITFDDDIVTISGEKLEEKREEREDKRFHVFERTYGTFRRSFSLPSNVDPSRVVADFRNGVLTVHLPKSESEKPKGRKIPITVTK